MKTRQSFVEGEKPEQLFWTANSPGRGPAEEIGRQDPTSGIKEILAQLCSLLEN